MIEITLTAQNRIRHCLEENPGKVPRIHFSDGGISGPILELSFEQTQKDDIVEEMGDFRVNIAEDVSYFARKIIVDYDGEGKDGKFNIQALESLSCNEDCSSCRGCAI